MSHDARERAYVSLLPSRYFADWPGLFLERASPALRDGVDVLDVGSGARPWLAPELRPSRCRYVGLDISADELAAAPPGSYDEARIADVAERVTALEERFDLIVSWQALEHVESMERTLENLHAYLRPRGRLVALMSGRFAGFALLNQLLPQGVSKLGMKLLLHRDPDTVFEAHYDRCYHGALRSLLARWSESEIVSLYCGASYFGFARTIQRMYLAYEEWAYRSGRTNLATHYLVTAVR